jgi:hypothetical protein
MKLVPIGLLLLSACGGVAALPAIETPSASRADQPASELRRLVEDWPARRPNPLVDVPGGAKPPGKVVLVDVPKGARPPGKVMYELALVNVWKDPYDPVFFLESLEPGSESGVTGYVIEVNHGTSPDTSNNHYWLMSKDGARRLHGTFTIETRQHKEGKWLWTPWAEEVPKP